MIMDKKNNDKINEIETLALSQLKERMNLNHEILTLRLKNTLKAATIESNIYNMVEEQFNNNKSLVSNDGVFILRLKNILNNTTKEK